MLNAPHLFDLCVLIASGSGSGLTFWLLRRHVDDRLSGLHEDLSELFSGLESSLKEDFQSHIKTAKDQLSGMDRRVCYACKRMFTQFEATAKGALCRGCGGKV